MISINKSAYLNREASPLAPCLMNALVSANDINESLIKYHIAIQNVMQIRDFRSKLTLLCTLTYLLMYWDSNIQLQPQKAA